MSSASGWRIGVSILLMGVCGWLIYGAVVGGATAEERHRERLQRPVTLAAPAATERGAKSDAPKARPGHPGPDGKPPRHVPPNTGRAAALIA